MSICAQFVKRYLINQCRQNAKLHIYFVLVVCRLLLKCVDPFAQCAELSLKILMGSLSHADPFVPAAQYFQSYISDVLLENTQ